MVFLAEVHCVVIVSCSEVNKKGNASAQSFYEGLWDLIVNSKKRPEIKCFFKL